jgi:TonB dependent receptor/CarboxypepD_reg-like domain/TonB-dependent Receptor Plug Domain
MLQGINKYNFFTALFFLAFLLFSFSQKKCTISGIVKDAKTGESVIGATVFVQELKKGVVTNTYGFYSITLDAGNVSLACSFIGFQKFQQSIDLNADTRLNIDLVSISRELQTVEISDKGPQENVNNTRMSTINLSMEEIKRLPAFLGEVDILKTLQLLPGVKSGGDGNSGFYVRGGGPDQNLILLDEATIYNASHLLGFFSVFNGDAIKNVELTKGGMPAQYGQRISSVIDISLREGNNQNFKVQGGISPIASRLTVEGPIIKNKSSFIISGRRTYLDRIVKPFISEKSRFYGSSYYFYDLNTKFNYIFSDKDRLYFSAYYGRDKFTYVNAKQSFKAQIDWGNATAALRWNHIFSPKVFVNTSAIFTSYDFSFSAEQRAFEFKLFSGVRDWNFKSDLSFYPNARHQVKAGVNYVYHTFIPSNVSAQIGAAKLDLGKIIRLYNHDASIYIQDDFDVTEKLKINAGLRFGYFAHVGPFDRFVKDNFNNIVDTIIYKRGKLIKDYNGLEPRLSIRYKLSSTLSVKANYTRNFQYVHLANSSSVSLPTDVWVPSTEVIKPQRGDQVAVGIFKNWGDNMYESSIESYYKDMRNLIEYKEGSTPGDNVFDNPDNSFTYGKGKAYGVELFLRKNKGKLTGWLGYTLSYSTRQFADVNNGEQFYAKYDRRHDASAVANYALSNRWSLSGVWVYSTGNRGTLIKGFAFLENRLVDIYQKRNAFLFAPYHRLDLSATYTPNREAKVQRRKEKMIKQFIAEGKDTSTIEIPKKWALNHESSWTFSVFNAYNRYNPYFIYIDTTVFPTNFDFNAVARQVTLFPLIPSITYNFKF